MPDTKPKRTPEELTRLGSEVFERRVRPVLRPDDADKFFAVDVDTGDFEINEDDYTAVMGLRARRPSADIWLGRVGHPAAYQMRQSR